MDECLSAKILFFFKSIKLIWRKDFMKRILYLITFLALLPSLTFYGQDKKMEDNGVKISIKVGKTILTATLINNATTRALIAKFPITLQMEDLFNREMCFHFADALPTDNVQTTGYEVGEIIYWPPRHSLVIMYAQNGERFSMQKIGRIESGVEIFKSTGGTKVTFEVLK